MLGYQGRGADQLVLFLNPAGRRSASVTHNHWEIVHGMVGVHGIGFFNKRGVADCDPLSGWQNWYEPGAQEFSTRGDYRLGYLYLIFLPWLGVTRRTVNDHGQQTIQDRWPQNRRRLLPR